MMISEVLQNEFVFSFKLVMRIDSHNRMRNV
jgi:hypothetical protein